MVKLTNKSHKIAKTQKKNKLDIININCNSEHTTEIQQEECPICYQVIKDRDYIITKCNHKFCNNCLFNSLKINSDCPICRQEIFKFDKIKELNFENISALTYRTGNYLDIFKNITVNSLINGIKHNLENNVCLCVGNNVKEALITVFNCDIFNIELLNLFDIIIDRSFKRVSMLSYENIIRWLKDN